MTIGRVNSSFLAALGAASLCALLSLSSRAALAADTPPEGDPIRIVVGLDLSKSNPLVDDEAYADKAAEAVAAEVREMPFKSKLMIRTFGSYSGGINALRVDRTISAARKPEDAAVFVEALIAGVPAMVAKGQVRSQNHTNIIAFLENVAQQVDCEKLDTVVILISDGFEDSEYANLKREGAKLPLPKNAEFEGCAELRILGLGQGQSSPSETKRLRDEWAAWAEAAGFVTFTGLNDW